MTSSTSRNPEGPWVGSTIALSRFVSSRMRLPRLRGNPECRACVTARINKNRLPCPAARSKVAANDRRVSPAISRERQGMDRQTVNGLSIAYELLGNEGDPAVALTPGGRFTMDVPGLREMAEAFVAAGRRVLIYDRPNCGYSDACLLGESESEMQAEALAGLIKGLGIGPVVIA